MNRLFTYQVSGQGHWEALMEAAFRHPKVMGAEKVFVDVFEEDRVMGFIKVR